MARRAKGDVYNTGYSQVVPRQGTRPARQDFTSVFGWEPVFFPKKAP